MTNKKTRVPKLLTLGTLGTAFIITILITLFPILTRHFELKITDLKFNLREVLNREPSLNSSIVLVKLGDESKTESGLGLWPYSYYAQVLKNITTGGPTSVGMDFMFTVSVDTAGWKELVDVMLETGLAVNPYLVKYGNVGERLDIISQKDLLDALKFDELPNIAPGSAPHVADIPYKSGGTRTDFLDASLGLGLVNLNPDEDGILRRIPIVSEVNGMLAPHFILRLLAAHLEWDLSKMELVNKRKLILHEFPLANTIKDLEIPLDGKGSMLVNYISRDKIIRQNQAGEFKILSAWKIYNSDLPPPLSGKTVVFGDHSAAGKDFNPTPIDSFLPNPLVFVMAMSNILEESFIYPVSGIAAFFILLILILLLLALVRFTDVFWFGIGSFLLIFLYLVINFSFFIYSGFQIPVLSVMLPTAFAAGFALIYLVYDTQVSMGVLEGSLQSYLSPNLMDKFKNDPEDMLKLGGERKRISVMFSDIVQFTKFTDEADPAEVQSVLEEYFSQMAEIVFKNGGIIDKYMGDGILAFFENPPDAVTSAQAAVKTAVAMQEKAIVLHKKYMEQNRFPFAIRVGISTGYAKVGNIGPKEKIDYTIIGSVVNRGSRLDGVGSPGDVVLDEDTYFFVKEDYQFEDFGTHILKGFEKPVQVYKLEK